MIPKALLLRKLDFRTFVLKFKKKKLEHLNVPVSQKLLFLPDDRLHWSLLGFIKPFHDSNGLKDVFNLFFLIMDSFIPMI